MDHRICLSRKQSIVTHFDLCFLMTFHSHDFPLPWYFAKTSPSPFPATKEIQHPHIFSYSTSTGHVEIYGAPSNFLFWPIFPLTYTVKSQQSLHSFLLLSPSHTTMFATIKFVRSIFITTSVNKEIPMVNLWPPTPPLAPSSASSIIISMTQRSPSSEGYFPVQSTTSSHS